MAADSADEPLDNHIQFRADDTTVTLADNLQEQWGLDNRSEAFRLMTRLTAGALYGQFFGLVDPDRLEEEWGELGGLLSHAIASEDGLPEDLRDTRLADIVEDDIRVLARAAEVEFVEESL